MYSCIIILAYKRNVLNIFVSTKKFNTTVYRLKKELIIQYINISKSIHYYQIEKYEIIFFSDII